MGTSLEKRSSSDVRAYVGSRFSATCFVAGKLSSTQFGLSGAFSIDSELLVRLFDPPQKFVCSAFLKFPFDIPARVSTPITRLCT